MGVLLASTLGSFQFNNIIVNMGVRIVTSLPCELQSGQKFVMTLWFIIGMCLYGILIFPFSGEISSSVDSEHHLVSMLW